MDGTFWAQQLFNGLVLGSIYGLIAVGYTMVYGILGMINFAHGEVYMISAYLTAIFIALFQLLGLPSLSITLFLAFIAAAAITGLYGWTIERAAYRPLRSATRLAPLISAIGVSLLLQNFVRVAQGARSQAVPDLIDAQWSVVILGQHVEVNAIQIIIIVAAAASMLLLHALTAKTALGRAMRATQQDRSMAAILGVNPDRIIPFVFVIGAVMAALAGTLVSLNYGSFDFSIGFVIGIKAFTSAVLGGIGSLIGAMCGGIILGMAESLFSGYVNVDYKDVFAFSLLILVLIFKPSGLFGTPDVEKV